MSSQPASVVLPVHHWPQRQTGECLAACAAMVLAYCGRPTAYNRLLRQLNVRDFGAPFSNLRRLNRLGVKVLISKGDFDQLYSELSRNHPCIASVQTAELPHWNGRRSEHAVVVVGMDQQYIYLNDPGAPIGRLQVPRGDFDLAWLEQEELYAVIIA